MDHSGMDMGGSSDSGMGACKISMLFNWTTIDACFLTEQWHVRSVGDFVGSLIGIFFFVVALEAVRRIGRDYDRRIRAAYYRREGLALAALAKNSGKAIADAAPFRPSHQEQAVRSVFHFVQFGAAYILMLLAMYFNLAVLLTLFAGAGVGYFLFGVSRRL
ncbi:copper transporter family protein [Rhodotorula paludigena]|uniref:copper transporter family protein n=1 Tax=Rhodotorula paludigena TaxID=86838 RepID=UPI003178965A